MSFILLGILNSQVSGGAVGPGDYDLLESQILTQTENTVTFSGLDTAYSADYQHLQWRVSLGRPGSDDQAGGAFKIQSGSDLGYYHRFSGSGSGTPAQTSGSGGLFSYGGNGSASKFTSMVLDLVDAFETTKNPTLKWMSGVAGTTEPFVQVGSAYRNNTFAIASIDFYAAAGFTAKSRFSLYGYRKVAV